MFLLGKYNVNVYAYKCVVYQVMRRMSEDINQNYETYIKWSITDLVLSGKNACVTKMCSLEHISDLSEHKIILWYFKYVDMYLPPFIRIQNMFSFI